MLTQSFANELADRLLSLALSKIADPQLKDLLNAQAYFRLYAQRPNFLLEADAPAWLKLSLELLDQL